MIDHSPVSAVGRMGNLGKILKETTPGCGFLSCSRTHTYLLLLFSIFILPILPTPRKTQRSSQLDGQDVGQFASACCRRAQRDSPLFKTVHHIHRGLHDCTNNFPMGHTMAMAELPKNAPNDFVKSLFWSLVLVGLFAALVVALLFLYYRPTFEYVR